MSTDVVPSRRMRALVVGVTDEAERQRLHASAAPDWLPEASDVVWVLILLARAWGNMISVFRTCRLFSSMVENSFFRPAVETMNLA